MDLFCYLCLWYSLFCFLKPCGQADLLALLYVMFSRVFVTFPIRYPGSDVTLDCIDSRSLPSSLLAFGRPIKSRL